MRFFPSPSVGTVADASVTASKIASNAATGPKIASGSFKQLCATGRNGAGSWTVTGLAVGDVIQNVTNVTDGGDVTADFSTVGLNSLTQTSATDYSSKKLLVLAKSGS